MKAKVKIDAGICGFHTKVEAVCDDSQNVELKISTGCEKIKALAGKIENIPIDAYQEISPGSESLILDAGKSQLQGCCAGCVVPPGIFKAMQAAAGLALPKDIEMKMTRE